MIPTPSPKNRARLRHTLGLPSEPLWLTQMHGIDVVDRPRPRRQRYRHRVTDCGRHRHATCAGQVCVIQTADCLPVLVAHQARYLRRGCARGLARAVCGCARGHRACARRTRGPTHRMAGSGDRAPMRSRWVMRCARHFSLTTLARPAAFAGTRAVDGRPIFISWRGSGSAGHGP